MNGEHVIDFHGHRIVCRVKIAVVHNGVPAFDTLWELDGKEAQEEDLWHIMKPQGFCEERFDEQLDTWFDEAYHKAKIR